MMKSYYLTLLVLAIIGCSGPSVKEKTSNTTNTKESTELKANNKKTIVFFGNSLTAGYGLDISEAFPAKIQELIDSLGFEYEVINAGLSGETTSSGNSRIDWVLKNNVNVFVLELGANDGLRGIPTKETRKNLQEIIDKVTDKYPSAKIVLAGMQVPPNMGEEYSRDFRSIFPEIASINNAALIPFILENVAGEPDLNLPDGIHPTAYGHELVAQNVWLVLKDLL